MKYTLGRSVLPQRARRTRSRFSASLLRAFCALCGENTYFKNTLIGSALILTLAGLLVPPRLARAATPTLIQAITVKVIVHLLDANNQPLLGVTVNLVLNRYGDTIEELKAGSCVTDATGSCAIIANGPPRLRSGKIEGFIDLGAYGRQLIGCKGERFEITLQLYPDGKLDTAPAPLDQPYEGQTEQPTDAPLSTPTGTPMTTATPIATATAFLNTATHAPPTATVTAPATATVTPQVILPAPAISSTPIPTSHLSQRLGWAWIGLGLALFAVLGIAFAIHYHCQRK
jgi:hypothetical protein